MAEGDPVESKSWLDRHLWQIQPLRDIGVIAGVLFLFWLGYVLSIVTVPLLLAVAFAYLFEPFVRWLVKQNLFGRSGAAAFIIGIIALVTIVPVGVGGTYAVIQGADVVLEIRDDAQAFREAIDEENRDDEVIQGRVTGQPWEWLLGAIEGERTRKDQERAALEEIAAEEAAMRAEDEAAFAEESAVPDVDPPVEDVDNAPTDSPSIDDEVTDAEAQPSAADDAEAAEEERRRLRAEREARLQELRDEIKRLEEPSDIERTVTLAVQFVENNASAISSRVVRTGAGAFDSFIGLVTSLGLFVFTIFLTCFFFFFICTSYGKVLKFGESLIPENKRTLTLHLLKRFDGAVSGFIRGRITIAFIQAIVFSIGYWIIGVPAPLLLGAGVAVLSIVPYAALVGIPISIVLLQLEDHTGFRGEIWWVLGAPTAIYFIGQALDDYVWTPLIQGKSTGMDTPTILFATLAGGALLGIYGLLLAIPLAACIKILLEEIFWPRFKQWSKGETPDFLPIPKE
ncbi:MAG: AI-2E family transporter [Planctomycetota bacterium]